MGQSSEELLDAQLLSDQGQYLASIEILDNFILANPNRLYDLSSAWFLESYNYLQLGELKMSAAANETSIILRDQLRSEDLAENYLRKGEIYIHEGDFPKAMNYLLEATELPTDDPLLSADINIAIAKVYAQLEDYQSALNYYQFALDVLMIELDKNHINIAQVDFDIGRIYTAIGERTLAQEKIKKGLRVALGYHRNMQLAGSAFLSLGMLEQDQEKAVYYFDQALDVYQRGAGHLHPDVAKVYLERGRLYLSQKKWIEAKKNLQSCIDILENPAGFVNSRQATLAIAWVLMAKLDLQQKGENESSLLSALSKCEAAKGYFLENYDLAMTDEMRLDLLNQVEVLFDMGVYTAGKLYELTKEEGYLSLAFTFMELPKMKANYIGYGHLKDADAAKRLIKQNNRFLLQIFQGEAELLQKNKKTRIREQLKKTRAAYRQFQMRMALNNNEFFNDFYHKGTIEIKEIQRQLSSNDVLLNYHVGSEYLTVIAVTAQKRKLIQLPINGDEKLADLVTGFHRAVFDNQTKKIGQDAYLLYQQLLLPLKPVLSKKKNLIIIPDQYLAGLPYELLIQKKPRRYKSHKYDYLVKDYSVSYTASATFFFNHSDEKASLGEDFLLVTPNFKEDEAAGIDTRNSWLFDTTLNINPEFSVITKDGEYYNIKEDAELNMTGLIEKITDQKKKIKSLNAEGATEALFKSEAPGADHVLFSSYSFSSHSPLFSGLVLSSDYSEEDGVLYSREIRGLQLQADLLVLTDHLGSPLNGFNPMYLANDFVAANVGQVLIPVYNSGAGAILNQFYPRLLKGETASLALQKSKKKLLKNKKIAPREWGNFLLFR